MQAAMVRGSPIVKPTPEQLQPLSPMERRSFAFAEYVNTHPVPKAAAQLFLRWVGSTWVYVCSRNLTHLLGLGHLRDLRPRRGLLLVCNHRSMFDQYVVSCWLFRLTRLLGRLYFPVRSEFWYDSLSGMLVSGVMSAWCMYPPVFRDPAKREFNRYGLQRLVQILQQPGAVVGMHPEGTRNKGPDPYALLRAQPGTGRLIIEARPTVLPVFVNGLGNDFAAQVRGNFDGTGQPIIVVFGRSLDLSLFYARRSNLRTYKELSDHVLEQIRLLGQHERLYRQGLSSPPPRGPLMLDDLS